MEAGRAAVDARDACRGAVSNWSEGRLIVIPRIQMVEFPEAIAAVAEEVHTSSSLMSLRQGVSG